VLPFPVELLRFLENNTSLSSALSATQSAAAKLGENSESGERPGVADMVSSAPDVVALEAREPGNADQPALRTANGLSPVPNDRSSLTMPASRSEGLSPAIMDLRPELPVIQLA
jgi:hypothetical protein